MVRAMSTPEHWAFLQRWAADGGRAATGLVELRARVEVLEAGATCPHVRTSDEGTSYCALAGQHQDKLDRLIAQDRAASAEARPAPASSLVERVAATIAHEGCLQPEVIYGPESRAAICEVATWLEARGSAHWLSVAVLRQQADQ
jgi:hypothetical protein